jgi:5-methylcytosine-specific restriction endonuclease McrA
MEYKEYLQTKHWKIVRENALSYWDNKCALCFSEDNLNVHHRTYLSLGGERDNDVIVLCKVCHERHHETLEQETSDFMWQFWNNVREEIIAEGDTLWQQCPG